VQCRDFLLDIGVKPSWETIFYFAHCNYHRGLQWVLWDALPPVSVVQRAQQEMSERAYLKEDSKRSNDALATYVKRFRNRSSTLAACMWVMCAVPGAIWRDLSEIVVGNILQGMPIQAFVRQRKTQKETKKVERK
jgi:hypothetical protein